MNKKILTLIITTLFLSTSYNTSFASQSDKTNSIYPANLEDSDYSDEDYDDNDLVPCPICNEYALYSECVFLYPNVESLSLAKSKICGCSGCIKTYQCPRCKEKLTEEFSREKFREKRHTLAIPADQNKKVYIPSEECTCKCPICNFPQKTKIRPNGPFLTECTPCRKKKSQETKKCTTRRKKK